MQVNDLLGKFNRETKQKQTTRGFTWECLKKDFQKKRITKKNEEGDTQQAIQFKIQISFFESRQWETPILAQNV